MSVSEEARGDGLSSFEAPATALDDALLLDPSLSAEAASARERRRASRRSTRSLHWISISRRLSRRAFSVSDLGWKLVGVLALW